jgi:hypothetical protein
VRVATLEETGKNQFEFQMWLTLTDTNQIRSLQQGTEHADGQTKHLFYEFILCASNNEHVRIHNICAGISKQVF